MDVDMMDDCGYDGQKIYQGRLITDWPDGITFAASEYEPNERANDVLVTYNFVPVYSARLQAAILNAGIKDFQFLPCRVINGRREELPGFAVANVIQARSAFSPEHGRALYWDPNLPQPFIKKNVKYISRDALNHSELNDCDVFRLNEYPFFLYASEKFRKAYKSLKATGISFREALVVK